MARNTAACDRCDTRVARGLQHFGFIELRIEHRLQPLECRVDLIRLAL